MDSFSPHCDRPSCFGNVLNTHTCHDISIPVPIKLFENVTFCCELCGLSVDEWWKETGRIEEVDEEERRCTEITPQLKTNG